MKYQIIYADPPWKYLWGTGKKGGNFAPEKHYETMPVEEICELNVKDLRDKNCALFLWTTMPALPEAMKVIEAWGFKYKTCAFTWVKIRKDGVPLMGPGSYSRANAEIVLLGMRGHIKSISHSVPQILMHQRLGHYVKPPIIRERIVELFGDITRIELFARQKTEGWDAIGYGIDGISVQEKIEMLKALPASTNLVLPTKKNEITQPEKLFAMQNSKVALSLGRRAYGFEVNKNAFDYQISMINKDVELINEELITTKYSAAVGMFGQHCEIKMDIKDLNQHLKN